MPRDTQSIFLQLNQEKIQALLKAHRHCIRKSTVRTNPTAKKYSSEKREEALLINLNF